MSSFYNLTDLTQIVFTLGERKVTDWHYMKALKSVKFRKSIPYWDLTIINKAFVRLGSCDVTMYKLKGQSSNMQTGQDFK